MVTPWGFDTVAKWAWRPILWVSAASSFFILFCGFSVYFKVPKVCRIVQLIIFTPNTRFPVALAPYNIVRWTTTRHCITRSYPSHPIQWLAQTCSFDEYINSSIRGWLQTSWRCRCSSRTKIQHVQGVNAKRTLKIACQKCGMAQLISLMIINLNTTASGIGKKKFANVVLRA